MIDPKAIRSFAVFGLACCIASVGCDSDEKKAPIAPRSRSQAIMGPTVAESSPPLVATPPSAQPAKKPRKLCVAGASAKGTKPSAEGLVARARPGEALPENDFGAKRGSWQWVNFWAAWCAPCKEEIPRLRRWEKQLVSEGVQVRMVFISLDDDERQLDRYLAKGGQDGLGATLWLREGKEREAWLQSVGMDPDPELPAHLLLGPDGSVRCAIQGAVEDQDYDEAKAVFVAK